MLNDPVELARAAERGGRWDEALEHYEAALSALPEDGGPERAADILRWIGSVHRERRDLAQAEELYTASLALARAAELPVPTAGALNCLGVIEQYQGHLDAAERLFREALAVEGLEGTRYPAAYRQNLAVLATIRGDTVQALEEYGSALRAFRAAGDDLGAASTLSNMGMGHVDLRAWDDAAACYDEAYRLAERIDDSMTVGLVCLNRAELHLRKGEFAQAREQCDEAFEIFNRLSSGYMVADAHKLYGMLYRDTAKSGLAGIHFSAAVELARSNGDPLLEAETLAEWALLQWEEAQRNEALHSLNRARRIFSELGAKRDILDLERRLGQIENTYLMLVKAWGESIESKDRYTAGHCERVANFACALASESGITGHELTWFRMGAFLHDVGKIEVPAEVLNKPGMLTDEERHQMEMHTVEGDRIIAELDFPGEIRQIVRSHHERWDGLGYPDGLKGEEIPLIARILCVADVYDALTTTRSYRPALSHEQAIAIMDEENGTRFDPELYGRFRKLIVGLSDPGEMLPDSAHAGSLS
jgi:putative nucleotidyltransferase with HDIG domain